MTAVTERVPTPPLHSFEISSRRREQRRHRAVADLAVVLAALGFGATLGSAVAAESFGALRAPGGLVTMVGRVAGLSGAYLLLLMVLLMARIPAIEAAVGQERLARWHRRIGGWPVALIAIHVVFITFGYAESTRTGFWREAWTFLTSYPDVLAAAAALALLVLVAVLSIRAARRRLRYESWWAIHLYVYLALALAFAHQLTTGASFVGHPLTRLIWSIAWASTAGSVLGFRVGLPLWRSVRHQLRVVAVRPESSGVVSIVCKGQRLERLRVRGGQFFQWRFLAPGLWWQAHPYSLSALPRPPYLRLTFRPLGDHSRSLAALKVGTRVALEGPYGTFTARRRGGEGVLLVAAGVGITPIRALLDDLPAHVDTTLLVRASSEDELILHDETTRLVAARGGHLHELVGPRQRVRLDAKALRQLVPDIARRDLYVCGPADFTEQLIETARRLGVAEERIHHETFGF